MSQPLTSTRWSWIGVSLAFLVLAMASHKLVEPLDVLLAKARAPLAMDIVIDLLMVLVSAFGCSALYMAWFGASAHTRHRLAFALVLSFTLWTLFSFMQIGALLAWAPIVWALAPYTAAELIVGAAFVWGAALAAARIIDLLPRRPTAAGVS